MNTPLPVHRLGRMARGRPTRRWCSSVGSAGPPRGTGSFRRHVHGRPLDPCTVDLCVPLPWKWDCRLARSKNTYFSAKYRRLIADPRPDEGRRRRPTLHDHRRLDTCSPTASSTATPVPTTSPATSPQRPEPEQSDNSKPSDTGLPCNHNSKPDSQLVHPRATPDTAGTEPHLGTGSPACRHLHLRVSVVGIIVGCASYWIAGEPGTV